MANNPLTFAGAETGDITLEAQNSGGTSSIVTSPINSGARAFRCNPTTTNLGWINFGLWSATTGKYVTANTASTIFLSYSLIINTLPAATHEILSGFYTGLVITTPVATLRITSAGLLAVYDSAGALVATGSTVLTTAKPYRIDFSANRTTGAYQVNVNGTSELSGSGAAFGAANIGNAAIGKVTNTNGNGVDYIFDDVWFDNAGFAPQVYRMAIGKPTANGTTMNWTNSDSGTGDFSHVNAVPASTATFVQDPAGTSLPVIAQFAMQTFAQMGIPVGSTILGIQVHGYFKDGVLTPTNTMKMGIISGVTKSINATGQNTTGAYVNFGRVIQDDPNTGVAWTQAGIEAMQWYAEEGTTAVNTNAAAALVTVVYSPPTANFLPFM